MTGTTIPGTDRMPGGTPGMVREYIMTPGTTILTGHMQASTVLIPGMAITATAPTGTVRPGMAPIRTAAATTDGTTPGATTPMVPAT